MKGTALRVLAAALIVSACTEWHTSHRAANGSYPPDRIPRAKVTLVEGMSVELLDTRIREDSVIGTQPASRARMAIATKRVSQIESLEFSQSRTLGLFASLGIAFAGITLYLVAHND
jgi:hypothetical protein